MQTPLEILVESTFDGLRSQIELNVPHAQEEDPDGGPERTQRGDFASPGSSPHFPFARVRTPSAGNIWDVAGKCQDPLNHL